MTRNGAGGTAAPSPADLPALRALADAMPHLVWTASADGWVLFYNQRRRRYGAAEAAADDHREPPPLIHPDDQPATETAWRDALASGAEYQIEHRLRMSDGTWRWHLSRAVRQRGPDGEVLWYGTATDIHDLKHTERTLREREHLLQRILDVAPNVVHVVDLVARRNLFINRTVEAELGYKASEVRALGDGVLPALMEPDDLLDFEKHMARLADLADGEIAELEFRMRDRSGMFRWFASCDIVFSRTADGRVRQLIGATHEITERKRAEERQALLIQELNHRVKNTLALVQATAQQSFKGKGDPAAKLEIFADRLEALAAAHTLLTQSNWRGSSLKALIDATLEFCGDLRGRITQSGEEVWLSTAQAVPMAMVLHELCTNAVKYGALSGLLGRVEIGWQRQRGALSLEWREIGGPPVSPPQRRGFGSNLIENAVSHQLGGRVHMEFHGDGLRCEIALPLPETT